VDCDIQSHKQTRWLLPLQLTKNEGIMLEQRFSLSPTGYKILKQELAIWETPLQGRSADFNDTNNTSLDSAPANITILEKFPPKEYIEDRITDLKYILARADIIADDLNPQLVDTGDRVTVWDFDEKCEQVFRLVNRVETNHAHSGIPSREISLNSPVAQALLGKRVGDIVEVKVPDGKMRYAIRHIELIA
jgi:transcription elongation factor GreA